jgi:hypothetical protein
LNNQKSCHLLANVTGNQVHYLRFFERLGFASRWLAFEDQAKGMSVGNIEKGQSRNG